MTTAARLVPRHAPPPRSPARDVLAREIERLAAAERDAVVAADIVARVAASAQAAEQEVARAEKAVVVARTSAAEAIASPTPTGSPDLRAARRVRQEAEDDRELAREAKQVADRRRASTAAAVEVARLRVRAAASRVLGEQLERLVTEAEAARADFVRRREVIALLCFDLTKSMQSFTLEERRHAGDIGGCDGERELGFELCRRAAEKTGSAAEIAGCQAWLNAFDALQRDPDAALPER